AAPGVQHDGHLVRPDHAVPGAGQPPQPVDPHRRVRLGDQQRPPHLRGQDLLLPGSAVGPRQLVLPGFASLPPRPPPPPPRPRPATPPPRRRSRPPGRWTPASARRTARPARWATTPGTSATCTATRRTRRPWTGPAPAPTGRWSRARPRSGRTSAA